MTSFGPIDVSSSDVAAGHDPNNDETKRGVQDSGGHLSIPGCRIQSPESGGEDGKHLVRIRGFGPSFL